MKKFIVFIILAIIFGVIFFWSEILDFYSKLTLNLPQQWAEEKVPLIEEIEKKIATPPPLRTEKETPESFLTQAGIIQWTNSQREKEGLPPLKESPKLSASALMKAEDMLAKQYFEHISSSGEGVDNLAEKVGYQFIAIGENLALGDFQDDETLVQGWMDSPGHRENILSSQYQEIGAAVLRGEFTELPSSHASAEASAFEGKVTWLAVQHFALPLAACLQPSETILVEIEANQTQLKELEITLRDLELEIKKMRPRWGTAYDEKVERYNNLISQYNDLLIQTQALIGQYNNQVASFNECALK
jgi:uncharacterized protein YkwD